MTNVQDEAVTRLDSAVSEVFETMLERSCDPLEGEVDTVEGRIVARIQFTGAVDGECLLYASQATASVTAEALLGTPSEPHDPMVDDAIGELCNMIAGGWKSKLASPDSNCIDLDSGRDAGGAGGISGPVRDQVQSKLLLSGECVWGGSGLLRVPLPSPVFARGKPFVIINLRVMQTCKYVITKGLLLNLGSVRT